MHDVPRYATDRTSGCQRAHFFWKATLPSLDAPLSLNPCMFVFAGPCLHFPNLLKPAAGRFQPGFLLHGCRRFLSLTTGLAVSLDRNLCLHSKQEELAHEGMQGFGDTLDSRSELQSCHRSDEGRRAEESRRESAARTSFDDRLKCSCRRIKCDARQLHGRSALTPAGHRVQVLEKKRLCSQRNDSRTC